MNKNEIKNQKSSNGDIFSYLTEHQILDNYDFNKHHHLKILTDDFNNYANVALTPKIFKHNALIAARILNDKQRFSFFKCPITNIYPYREITLSQVHEVITKPKHYQRNTGKLREINDKKQAGKYKAFNFDYVTFSGTFTKRNENSIKKHSNLIVIDYDNVENVQKLKSSLLKDNDLPTELLFVSPSGKGIKQVVEIDTDKYSHLIYFEALQNYIKKKHGLEIDKSGKDISRACFLCYDPNAFINPKYYPYA